MYARTTDGWIDNRPDTHMDDQCDTIITHMYGTNSAQTESISIH